MANPPNANTAANADGRATVGENRSFSQMPRSIATKAIPTPSAAPPSRCPPTRPPPNSARWSFAWWTSA
eukprot:13362362-Alexandrium_andersonii.AAC.1